MEQQLVETLSATLQPDAIRIKAAEEHLRNVLHADPQTGQALLNIVFAGAQSVSLPIRQAAAVNLSIWVKERWGPFFSEFVGFSDGGSVSNALPVEQKPPIREALLNAFTLQETKLRGPLLKALINVASCDWPDEFPDLLPRVSALLRVQSSSAQANHAIEGALAFLDEWIYSSMDETSLLSITRDLFPDLERILGGGEEYSTQVRCHCVSILNQTLETLWLVKEEYGDAAKTVTQELLPKWLSNLEQIIERDPSSIIAAQGGFNRAAGELLALQAQAWQTLITATQFASHFKPRLPALQEKALVSLTSLQRPFQDVHLAQGAVDLAEHAGELSFFASPSHLAGKVVDFLGVILQRSKSAASATLLSAFVPLLCSFSRITSEEEEEWLENVSAFVAANEDEEMGVLNSSMRGRCADILADLIADKPIETLSALDQMAKQAHEQGIAQRQASQATWWKQEEASLALIGGVADHIVEQLEEQRAGSDVSVPFDLESIFAMSVMPHMSNNEATSRSAPFFLTGRCFVFASQFASVLPVHLATNFLDAAVQDMERQSSEGQEEGDAIVKISAVRCVKNFHRHLSDDVVRPYTARILARLAPLLLNANEDVLVLIVETLQAVAIQSQPGAEQLVPANLFGEMAAAAVQAWAKESMDRVLQSAIEDLLEAFARQSLADAAASTLMGALPVLAQLLQHEVTIVHDATKYRSGVVAEGVLEFAIALARGARPEILAQSNFVNTIFPPLFAFLTKSDDREAYSNAARLLSTLISKIPEPCLAWHNEQSDATSIQHILALVSRMISPEDVTESGGLAVGDLLTTLLRKRPQVLAEELPNICRAFVARLATASSTSLVQSLVVPLAFLMKDNVSSVVELLLGVDLPISIEGKEAQPAMIVLLRKWLEFSSSMQGFWNARVSAIGLRNLFDARKDNVSLAHTIDGVSVNGDLLPDNVNIIKTRSRARAMPDRYSQVPIPAKMLKVLIAEFRQATDGPPAGRSSTGDEDELAAADALSDDDDDEWGDEEDTSKNNKRNAFLSDMLGEDIDDDLTGLLHKNDEEQYGDDVVWNMQFRTYLLQFFQAIAQDTTTANALAPYLNAEEVQTLRKVVGQ